MGKEKAAPCCGENHTGRPPRQDEELKATASLNVVMRGQTTPHADSNIPLQR